MHLKFSAALLAAIVVLGIGCSQSPVAPTPASATASAAAAAVSATPVGASAPYGMKGQDVPFSGAVTGGLRMVPNPQNCPSGVTGMTNATGQALHLGNITYRTEQCVNPTTGVIGGKLLVLTAANGDELHGTFAGQTESPGNVGDQFHVAATFVFKGGTGRFENATGTAAMTAVLTHAASFPFPGRWEWTGTIRY
jgi:hypothetical protein